MVTMRDDGATDGVKNPNHQKVKPAKDFISSLPDQILQHIFSFIPTRSAMKTSVLSKRWRRVWCETPILDVTADSHTPNLSEFLTYYTAPKITSFHLLIYDNPAHTTTTLIEFAISHNVEKLVMRFGNRLQKFPVSFYVSSSLIELSFSEYIFDMVPGCPVSWKSLRNLSLRYCKISNEAIANILSGCPKLESLTLSKCSLIQHLDLSKSPSVKRLEIVCKLWLPGPTEIVAPHIHYLKLTNSHHKPSTLVDVSSLTEANLDVDPNSNLEIDFLQISMVLEMLAKLQNVERLTLAANIIQVLSCAELHGVPFPTLKVSTLIVETKSLRYVIPDIARLLQNSPGLKKLVAVHTTDDNYIIRDKCFDKYLNSQSLDPNQCWRPTYEMFPTMGEIYSMLHCKGATSKLLASFMELVLRNAPALETMVVQFKDTYHGQTWFEQLLQMPPTLSHGNNGSIVLNQKNYSIVASVSK